MNKTDVRHLIITVIACVLTGIIVIFINKYNIKKIAVVDAVKLFNSYNMKIELEGKAKVSLEVLAKNADSIKQVLNIRAKTQNNSQEELQELAIAYRTAEHQLEVAYQESNQEINELVWKRLNPIVDEFGKEENLRVIIGANGMGSILYYDDYLDRTQELIDFVNKKYEEGH